MIHDSIDIYRRQMEGPADWTNRSDWGWRHRRVNCPDIYYLHNAFIIKEKKTNQIPWCAQINIRILLQIIVETFTEK